MAFIDSSAKIVERYFSAVTLDEFTFKKTQYQPKKLRVGTGIFFRGMTCVEKCGACCARFSLDYIPSEADQLDQKARDRLVKRKVDFNEGIEIWSDTQTDHENHSCRWLHMETGRCGIHGSHPFSCDFELLRFYHFEDPTDPERLDHRPFGRGWAMKRIDGERGALCEWFDKPSDPATIIEVNRKLQRLKEWTDYFGIRSTLPDIMKWVGRGPHLNPLIIGPPEKFGFDLT